MLLEYVYSCVLNQDEQLMSLLKSKVANYGVDSLIKLRLNCSRYTFDTVINVQREDIILYRALNK